MKSNGKFRLLFLLRKFINLTSDEYFNNNHPVSLRTDAAQLMTGKKLFCKLDCPQAYHCLQMANQRSKEKLVFTFTSKCLPMAGYHKVLAKLNLHFQVPYVKIWTKSSQPIPEADLAI